MATISKNNSLPDILVSFPINILDVLNIDGLINKIVP